ncbi:hypothetical protein PV08_09450 [Exophiala spinifera]|uniref:CST complex subunit STN1 n=1 Tax=Exophiala spinifera TaxID=91928 RepID=A0A0D2B0C8_9EURO|nr:uncharacterized protein PV08_09450 [Exophiala spinifera]KIW12175.1 hypothetical protein PV08_09450 [Exophiala spinifera]
MQKLDDVKLHNIHTSDDNDSDSSGDGNGTASLSPPFTFYPAWAFNASQTWLKWVKLTAHDVHHVLQSHEKFSETTTTTTAPTLTHHGHGTGRRRRDAPLLLFYLNHPIQYVQVVGVVVAFDEYFEKFWLLTIDDSSGATLDVTCAKPEKEKEEREKQKQKQKQTGGSNPANKNARDERTTIITDFQDRQTKEGEKEEGEEDEVLLLHQTVPTLTIGTVVQAKGTLSTFRSCRQLSLLRLTVVRDTAQEVALIASRTSFWASTLCKPWTLSASELQSLRSEAEDEKAQETKRAQRRRQREVKRRQRDERHAALIAKAYQRDEGYRAKAADQARAAGERLQKKTQQ